MSPTKHHHHHHPQQHQQQHYPENHHQMSLYLRHRTFYVLLLCGLSMMGTSFLWWGKLPFDVSQLAQIPLTASTSTTTSTSTDNSNKITPPPFLFQSTDDDETADADYLGRGESIRTEQQQQQQPKKKEASKDPTKTTSSDVKNSNDETLMSIQSDADKKTSSKITVFEAPPTKSMQEMISSSTRTKSPKVVWLASYPNSGTSYTMTMVARASNMATATNYGREVTDKNEVSTPLFDSENKSWGGPFWNPNSGRPLPTDYILTKTHCGSRCIPCGPEEYLSNETAFLRECTRGAGLANLNDQNRDLSHEPNFMEDGYQWVHYDSSIVKKAIHLIRSPFDNIVSRFHLERKHYIEKESEYELQRYPNNATGFHRWCQDLNDQFGPNDDNPATDLLPRDTLKLMQKDLPCHGEFYKYVQWHNLANKVMKEKPTLVIHYEDYATRLNKTATKIFDFLHLERKSELRHFRFHSYDEYFSDTDREKAQKLMQQVATPAMWQQLERYF